MRIPIIKLNEDPYASAICYPKVISNELKDRIAELKEHGIKFVDFTGKNNAFGLPILGKGFVGIVLKVNGNGESKAVKILRVDASRKELQHEAKMLIMANSVKVGPKFQGVSKNCLLMELIEGKLLPFWLESNSEKNAIKKVYTNLLLQCRRLDKIGLDHGELSKAPKHIIINKKMKPYIVDFETASNKRIVSNVTSICQFLFLSYGTVGTFASKVISNLDRKKIIKTLKKYKIKKTNENFKLILQACSLENITNF